MAYLNRMTEVDFVFASLREFILCWQSKQKASFLIDCNEGLASINFSCNLGYPGACHLKPPVKPQKVRTKKTPSRTRCDNARAARFQKSAELGQSRTPAATSSTAVPATSASATVSECQSVCMSPQPFTQKPTKPKQPVSSSAESSPITTISTKPPSYLSPDTLRESKTQDTPLFNDFPADPGRQEEEDADEDEDDYRPNEDSDYDYYAFDSTSDFDEHDRSGDDDCDGKTDDGDRDEVIDDDGDEDEVSDDEHESQENLTQVFDEWMEWVDLTHGRDGWDYHKFREMFDQGECGWICLPENLANHVTNTHLTSLEELCNLGPCARNLLLRVHEEDESSYNIHKLIGVSKLSGWKHYKTHPDLPRLIIFTRQAQHGQRTDYTTVTAAAPAASL